jgi:hypothetical protein
MALKNLKYVRVMNIIKASELLILREIQERCLIYEVPRAIKIKRRVITRLISVYSM